MSHSARVLSWDAGISSLSDRHHVPGDPDLDPIPTSHAGHPESHEERWNTRLQPRQSLGLRFVLSRKTAAEKKQHESLIRGGPHDAIRQLEGSTDDSPGIKAAITQDRSAIDGRRSIRALRIWDSVARRLEETTSPLEMETPELTTGNTSEVSESLYGESAISSPRSSLYSMPRPKSCRRDTVGRPERRSRIRRPSLSQSVPSETESKHAANRDVVSNASSDSVPIFPCPFRRRNPIRFNVRDHEQCAKTQFASTLDLRNHIIEHHQRRRPRHQCCRCGVELDTQIARDCHLMVPKDQICEIVSIPPTSDCEDDIPEGTASILTASDDWDWESIWRLLFPADKTVPDPDFYPVVELVEVEQALDDGLKTVKDTLHDKLRLLLPNTIEDSYCTFLAGQLQFVVETHHANIIRECLTKVNPAPAPLRAPAPVATKMSNAKDAGCGLKRSNRRSRRSTVLPTRSLSTAAEAVPDVAKEVSFIHLRPRLLDRNTIHSSPSERLSSIFSPSRARLLSSSPTTDISTPGRDEHAAPRDSRDSGIGIPCDVCESEICRCREIMMSLAAAKSPPPSDSDTELVTQLPLMPMSPPPPPPPPKDPMHVYAIAVTTTPDGQHHTGSNTGNMRRHSQIPLAVQPRSPLQQLPQPQAIPLRHQPKLRLMTTDIGLAVPEPDSMEGFSPQSFKQRVLRTHGGRYHEQVDWSV